MDYDCIAKKFQEYLSRINDIKEDRCWICRRTPDRLRNDFYDFKKDPLKGCEEIDLDDVFILTYRIQHPVCFSCYISIKQNPELIKEIMNKSEDEIWH